MSPVRFPNESPDYRGARDELLRAEIELSRQTERVAALRRRLPPGGELPTDYPFDDEGGEVRLSELFGERRALVLYSFMYGPDMEQPCPMCTSFLDALDAQAHHLTQIVALAVTARSPIHRIRAFARTRPWNRLRLLSCARSAYQRDYHGESETGAQMPMLNVFTREDRRVRHFWGSEMLYAPEEPGQDSRHIDILWPLWNVLDLTPAGRGTDWYPSLTYR
jgi:predicted dithiol-disulfide oxidoreductase (DUF899 family)